MTVRILELDKVSYLPFEAFLLAAWAPFHVIGRELGFPLGKRCGSADVEADVVHHGLGSRTRRQAMSIAIDPRIGHGSVGRVGGRKTKHLMRETREGFAIRHADT